MASKFVELSEAAKQLGITADELNDARNAGEVHGFRDGSSWKFKPQELERFAEERGVSLDARDNFDDLLDDLVVSGTEKEVVDGMQRWIDAGIGEVLAYPLLEEDRDVSIAAAFSAVAKASD